MYQLDPRVWVDERGHQGRVKAGRLRPQPLAISEAVVASGRRIHLLASWEAEGPPVLHLLYCWPVLCHEGRSCFANWWSGRHSGRLTSDGTSERQGAEGRCEDNSPYYPDPPLRGGAGEVHPQGP